MPSKRGRLRGAFANVFEIEWKKQPFPCRVSEKNGVALYSYKKEKKKDGNKKIWGIERSGFFNGREKWAKGFENQRV